MKHIWFFEKKKKNLDLSIKRTLNVIINYFAYYIKCGISIFKILFFGNTQGLFQIFFFELYLFIQMYLKMFNHIV